MSEWMQVNIRILLGRRSEHSAVTKQETDPCSDQNSLDGRAEDKFFKVAGSGLPTCILTKLGTLAPRSYSKGLQEQKAWPPEASQDSLGRRGDNY